MLGVARDIVNNSLDLDYVGVKAPMFSFSRLAGADPMLGVEMLSTGEVGCLGADLHEALQHGLLAAGMRFPSKGVLLSLGPVADKYWFADEARIIATELDLPIYATRGTAEVLAAQGHLARYYERHSARPSFTRTDPPPGPPGRAAPR